MKRFAVGSALSFRERKFYGLRGWDGKPTHPPMTDVPVGAYVIAFLMDLVSVIGGDETWARDLHTAGGYAFFAGAAFSLLATLTGFVDWLRMRAGSEVRRITNTHALSMIVVTVLVAVNLVWRWSDDAEKTGLGLLVLSGVIVGILTLGAAIGGSLVFDKGYRVRTRPADVKPLDPKADP